MSGSSVAAKHAHEHRFAGQELSHQTLEQAALHPGLHLDAGTHVEHGSGLGVDFFVLPQLDLQRLHDIADDFVFHRNSFGSIVRAIVATARKRAAVRRPLRSTH